jgi:hypothetical protein
MSVNRYGLSRDINESIKRIIRQKSGFGCIFCGSWIYEYEHIDPEYKDAKTHDPEKICLLCPRHHKKVTSGRISKLQVFDHYNHPHALSRGYANDYIELRSKFYVAAGRIFFTKPTNMLQVDDVDLLKITQPTESEPMKLSGKFFDNRGDLLLEIKENEMMGYTNNWDIEQEGSRTFIRRKRGEIVLQLNMVPPDVIEIERMHMVYGSSEIYTNAITGEIYIKAKNGASINFPNGQIITEGLEITETGITIKPGNLIVGGGDIIIKKLDYRAFIDNGVIRSE